VLNASLSGCYDVTSQAARKAGRATHQQDNFIHFAAQVEADFGGLVRVDGDGLDGGLAALADERQAKGLRQQVLDTRKPRCLPWRSKWPRLWLE